MASIIHFTRLTSASGEQVDLSVLMSLSKGEIGYIKDTLAKSVTLPGKERLHSFLDYSRSDHLYIL